jgi:tetratricopeptide (TPR) repeat protein
LQYGGDQYAPARDALTHFIELTPTAAPALALRGLCEFETGQYPDSLQDLQRAISLGAANQPRNARILLYHEAILLTGTGAFEQALGKFAVLVKQRPDNEDLVVGVGLAALRMPVLPRDADPARTELISMVGRASINVMTQDLAGAQGAFQQVFERYPSTPNAHYAYGYLIFPTDPDHAIEQFQQELAVSPHSAIAHAMLAWASGMRGDFDLALPNAEKAASEDPQLPMGQLVYGRALVETGKVTAGLPYLESLLRLEPGNLEAHMTLAKAYSKLGRKDDARQERLLCLKMADQNADQKTEPKPDQTTGQGAAANAAP